jgi:hypothetical protein
MSGTDGALMWVENAVRVDLIIEPLLERGTRRRGASGSVRRLRPRLVGTELAVRGLVFGQHCNTPFGLCGCLLTDA